MVVPDINHDPLFFVKIRDGGSTALKTVDTVDMFYTVDTVD